MWHKYLIAASLLVVACLAAQPCVPRDYGLGSIVCVCNSSYCDTVEPTSTEQLAAGDVRHYVTSKAGKRLEPMTMHFSKATGTQQPAASTLTFTVNHKNEYQRIFGFGGASTDSATINTFSLSAASAENLIRSYFSEDGIGYTFIRIPLAGSDFSTHKYEYTDDYPYDATLKNFNLTIEDFEYKIPFVKRAIALSPREVKLFTAAWSAPDWMKNIDNVTAASSLKKEYYQVYANYYVKFLEAYGAEGLTFWGLTPQNEPGMGLGRGYWNTMGWTFDQMEEYLADNLCPTLRASGFGALNLMINDHNRDNINEWLQLYKNETIYDCVTGMAVHWYTDESVGPSILTDAHLQYPDKFILYTEACFTALSSQGAVQLGSWDTGVRYMKDIIDVTNNWGTGWVDWNMALDEQGGPNWYHNFVDAPIIVNATADEFYKQTMFYALAHFSKFVPPGSVRIGLEPSASTNIESVAFLTPDNDTVVILHNTNDTQVAAVLSDPAKGSVSLNIPANSMNTILYK